MNVIPRMMIVLFVLLFGFYHHPVMAANLCTDAQLRKFYDNSTINVWLSCDLTLDTGVPLNKKVIIEGTAGSGVTLACENNEVIDNIEIRTRWDSVLQNVQPISNVTVRGCTILNGIKIKGVPVTKEASYQPDYLATVRSYAPSNISLDALTFMSSGRTAVYVFPGARGISVKNSVFLGYVDHTVIYLDAESSGHEIVANYFDVSTAKREHIAVDGAEYTRIEHNVFNSMVNGGIYLYRNCGERGVIRYTTPSYNVIQHNMFRYENAQSKPAVIIGMRNARSEWCGDDLQPNGLAYPYANSSSENDFDLATYNQVRYNLVQGEAPKLVFSWVNPDMNPHNDISENVFE